MAVYFHLSLVSAILIVLYFRDKFIGSISLTIVILLSLFASIAPKLLFDINPKELVSKFDEEYDASFTWWYTSTNNYGIAFFIGITFGYLLDSNIRISRSKTALFWIYTIVVCPLIFILHNSLISKDFSVPLVNIFLWYTLGKFLFCIGIAWVYYACCIERAGNISTDQIFYERPFDK